MTPEQLRRYSLTCVHLTAVALSVDLEMARQDGATTQQLAKRLGVSVQTLEELEAALCR